MSDEIRRVVLEILAETRSAEEGLKRTQTSIITLNQAAELAQKGFNLLRAGWNQLDSTLSRANEINQVTASFQALEL